MSVEIITADCRGELPDFDQHFDFVFIDPPFNIGHNYAEYDDSISHPKYFRRMIHEIIACCELVMGPKGLLALHGPDKLVTQYQKEIQSFYHQQIAWIIWYYRFGQCNRGNWINNHCHCLVSTPGESYTWNPDDVLVESDRVKYGDKRVNDSERGGSRVPGDVWEFSRIQGNNAERWDEKHGALVDHPNQLPEQYIERLILAYTNPGDWILDPCVGSGTTAVVADALGRNFIGFEIGEQTAASARKRVERGAVRVNQGVANKGK